MHWKESMGTGSAADYSYARTSGLLRRFVRLQVARLCGLALIGVTAFAVAALATWNVGDPSLSYATPNLVTNAMGFPGAVFADIVMQFFGLASVGVILPVLFWGLMLVVRRS